MVIQLLCELLYLLLSGFLPVLAFRVPIKFWDTVSALCDILVTGWGFISAFLDASYILGLLSFLLLFDGIVKGWSVTLYILRKIPFLHIS